MIMHHEFSVLQYDHLSLLSRQLYRLIHMYMYVGCMFIGHDTSLFCNFDSTKISVN